MAAAVLATGAPMDQRVIVRTAKSMLIATVRMRAIRMAVSLTPGGIVVADCGVS